MNNVPCQRLYSCLLTATVLLWPVFMPAGAQGGTYISSAHGSNSAGVDRTDTRLDGYARGNCAHCHEQHASIAGGEPGPETAGAASFALFAPNYNTAAVPGAYTQADNFCFYCHNSLGSGQAVVNYDYSRVFGGGAIGVTSSWPPLIRPRTTISPTSPTMPSQYRPGPGSRKMAP